MKIKIFSIGKNKERWLEEAVSEYKKRLRPYGDLEFFWAKDEAQLLRWLEEEKNIVCLDEGGACFTSVEFSDYLRKKLEEGGARASFVIGGAEGLPEALKKGYPKVSLSKMTFTHQCARLILAEQIYRAFEISKGSRYHK